MFCQDCEGIDSVIQIEIVDVAGDEPELHSRYYCVGCLRKKGFWCESHGVHTLIHLDDNEDSEEIYTVYNICLKCTLAELIAAGEDVVQAEAKRIREHLDEQQIKNSLVLDILARETPEDFRLVFSHRVMCILYKRSFDEALIDLVTDDLGRPQ